ncbi:MAG: hypothetical protein ACREU6_07390, partial [Steroidobacteraceae bacterium]
MRTVRSTLAPVILPLGLACMAPFAQAQAPVDQGPSASEEGAPQLEEIVVTASKRSDETLKEVPGSLTALTDKTLTNLGVIDFQEYLPYVPGLSS